MKESGLVAQLKCVSGNVYDLHQDRNDLDEKINKLYQFEGTIPKIRWVGDPYAVAWIGDPFLRSRITRELDEDMKPVKIITPELLNNLGIPLRVLYYDRESHCFVCVRGDAYVG